MTAVLCVIVAIVIVSTVRGSQRKRGIAKTIAEGVVAHGLLVAVQAPFSSTSSRQYALGRVWYFDPTAGIEVTIEHVFDGNSGMPPALYSIATGTMNLGVLGRRIQEQLKYRRQLEAQGLAKDEVDSLMIQEALEIAGSAPGGINGVEGPGGYMQLPEPVPVRVHLRSSANKNCRVVVTFPVDINA